MAASRLAGLGPCEFERLYTKSVPHIFEKIFFSLDHDTFKNCRDVCQAWKELFASKRYRKREKQMLQEEKNLLKASKDGNVAEVKRLLLRGVSPNFKDPQGMTPLIAAARKGDMAMIKMLLDRGAEPNAIDKLGKTPLVVAVYHGHNNVAKLLLGWGADPNVGKYYGRATLTWAVIRNHIETVQQCLEKAVDPNMIDEKSGKPVLRIALERGFKRMVKTLLDGGGDPNTVLIWAVQYGLHELHHGMVKECFDRGADVNKTVDESGKSVLCVAVERNNSYWIEFLLSMGADPSTVLPYAIANSTLKNIILLLDGGADPNVEDAGSGKCALHIAVEKGRDDVVKLLFNRGANPNTGMIPRSAYLLLKALEVGDKNVTETINEDDRLEEFHFVLVERAGSKEWFK